MKNCLECGSPVDDCSRKKFCSGKCQRTNKSRRKYGTRKCEYCSGDYVPRRETSRFCSEKCTLDHGRYVLQGATPAYEDPCPICGEMFRPVIEHKGRRKKYCSDKCKFKAQLKPKKCFRCGKIFYKGYKNNYCSEECWNKEYIRKCEICGQIFETKNKKQRLCQDNKCKKEEARRYYHRTARENYKAPNYICKVCGEAFMPDYGDKRRFYCSFACSEKSRRQTEAYKLERKAAAQRRRAKKRGAESELFNPSDIFEKDKWICQICGNKVNKRLNYPHLKSATIDHKIPLSKGGSHNKSNVQLAHFICNSLKGDKNIIPNNSGQLMIV